MKVRGVVLGILIAVLFALPGLALAQAGDVLTNVERKYQNAKQVLEAGQYQEAHGLFLELIPYQDSLKYVIYVEGILAAYGNTLRDAEWNFAVLADKNFLDSADMLKYVQARKAEEDGALEEALKLYREVDVLDSVSREVIVLGLMKKGEVQPGQGTGEESGSGLAFLTPLPKWTPLPTPRTTPRPTATKAPYIGTVSIRKSGYMSVREGSSSDSTIIFRVHYGERYLCTGVDRNGWYAILLPTGDIGYVTNDTDYTSFAQDTSSKTLSTVNSEFIVRALNKQTYLYSQPKTSAKTRRVSSNGTETTFYFEKGTLLACYGKTVRNNQVWYMLQPVYVDDQIREILWLPSGSCELVSGNPDANIIPDWWYD